MGSSCRLLSRHHTAWAGRSQTNAPCEGAAGIPYSAVFKFFNHFLPSDLTAPTFAAMLGASYSQDAFILLGLAVLVIGSYFIGPIHPRRDCALLAYIDKDAA
jgi:hypothetical protein